MGVRDFVERQDIVILFEQLSGALRGSTFQKSGKWYILVNRDDPLERQNFTIAHEYSEIRLSGKTELTPDEKHKLANRMASELLLPESEFASAVQTMDLHELKGRFPEASYEVIVRRIPLFIPSVVTIFDNRQITARFGSDEINFPKNISPLEKKSVDMCYASNSTISDEGNNFRIFCYYLEEKNGIRRVISIAVIDE